MMKDKDRKSIERKQQKKQQQKVQQQQVSATADDKVTEFVDLSKATTNYVSDDDCEDVSSSDVSTVSQLRY